MLSVSETRTFEYLVLQGENPSPHHAIAHVSVMAHKMAEPRADLNAIVPEYGFIVTDGDGQVLARIAPSYWPFIKKVIEATAAFHSPSCQEDCATEIGSVVIVRPE